MEELKKTVRVIFYGEPEDPDNPRPDPVYPGKTSNFFV